MTTGWSGALSLQKRSIPDWENESFSLPLVRLVPSSSNQPQ